MENLTTTQRGPKEELIREYNETFHNGSDLEGEDLYTLDESELEDFEQWILNEFRQTW